MRRAKAPNRGRTLETGLILLVLVLVLSVTGLLLSPTMAAYTGYSTMVAGGGNLLYATHMAAAVLLVLFTAWHLTPLAYALSRKAGTTLAAHGFAYALLALVIVEIVTGYGLWARDYRLIPKASAVKIHLATTFLLLLPLAQHAARGARIWNERRHARTRALAAAERVGKGAAAKQAHQNVTRRAFLRIAGYTAAGAALVVAFGRAVTEEISAWRLNSIGPTPALSKSNYRLKITGLVHEPLTLTFADIVAMGPVTKRFTHHCVEGWTYTDEFTGVPLRKVLERAGGAKPGAKQLIFKSPEVSNRPATRGRTYTTNFPYEDGLHDDMLLVYQVAGEDLPAPHGGPMRLMTPRKWGYKACKWLTEIEVTSDPAYRGYWESFGYHNDGDFPGPIFQ